MTPLIQKTVAHLKKEKIIPSPMWHFFVIRLLWFAAVVFTLLLSIALTAIALHITLEMNWLSLLNKNLGLREWVHLVIPILGIFLVLIFSVLAAHCFRKIHQYYRYTVGRIVLVFFLISFSLALILEFIPLDNLIEDIFFQWASPKIFLRNVLK